MAEHHRSSAAALLCSADAWVRLTSGSPLLVTVVLKLVHLFPVLCASLKIDKLSYVDSKIVNQILLCSLGSLVFMKNMILAFVVEFLEDLK